ncbi:MAG: dienelactone hydrolase family protein, partial [Pseudomonadota bacterium]
FAAAISIHGLFTPPPGTSPGIKAKVLALHGWDDPMAQPESVLDLAKEMSGAGADWQLHAYGGTLHAFSNPAAQNAAAGTLYSQAADQRSWAAITEFLRESFQTD